MRGPIRWFARSIRRDRILTGVRSRALCYAQSRLSKCSVRVRQQDAWTARHSLRTLFKLSGTYPLRYGIGVSGAFQHTPRTERVITYDVTGKQVPSLVLRV
jgi:hypothetical protein